MEVKWSPLAGAQPDGACEQTAGVVTAWLVVQPQSC